MGQGLPSAQCTRYSRCIRYDLVLLSYQYDQYNLYNQCIPCIPYIRYHLMLLSFQCIQYNQCIPCIPYNQYHLMLLSFQCIPYNQCIQCIQCVLLLRRGPFVRVDQPKQHLNYL